jgi:hypothetical protein
MNERVEHGTMNDNAMSLPLLVHSVSNVMSQPRWYNSLKNKHSRKCILWGYEFSWGIFWKWLKDRLGKADKHPVEQGAPRDIPEPNQAESTATSSS